MLEQFLKIAKSMSEHDHLIKELIKEYIHTIGKVK